MRKTRRPANIEDMSQYTGEAPNGLIPKFLQPYLRYSMMFYRDRKASLIASIDESRQLLEHGRQVGEQITIDAALEFIDTGYKNLRYLEQQVADDYYADDAVCSEHGIWIDFKSYYKDQAETCFNRAEGLKDLRKEQLTDEQRTNLESEIDKQTRFAYANLKKAGGIGWSRQGRIIEKLMEKEHG
ncbi:MAG: hypothetical protein ACJ8R9_10855 [Steroidobacteraceae bacterium]